jgi:hypothetical protein
MDKHPAGVALYFALKDLDPEFAASIRGTVYDPYYNDNDLSGVLNAWRDRLELPLRELQNSLVVALEHVPPCKA